MFSSNLKYLRLKNGMEQVELANRLGRKSGSTISEWEKGTYTPKIKTLSEIADLFDVDLDDLMNKDLTNNNNNKGKIVEKIIAVSNQLHATRQQNVYHYAEDQLEEQNNELNEDSNVYDLDKYRKKKTPVNGLLSAGTGAVNYEPNSTYEVEYEGKIPKHDLCFEVSGNSMEPMFENGEIIFVEKTYDIRSGQIIAVSINGEEYVKKAYLEEDHLRLVSLNKEYEDITAGEFDDIRVIGRIIL